MRHLDEGALRRLYDDPYSLSGAQREHFSGCDECRANLERVGDDARRTYALLVAGGSGVDLEAAFVAVKLRLGSTPSRSFRLGRLRPFRAPLAAAVLAAALVSLVAFTPLAQTLTRIFTPQQVTPITVQPSNLGDLGALASYGTVGWTQQPQLESANSAAEAATASGLPAIRLGYVPASLASQPVGYATMPQGSATFTFSEAKATAAAEAAGRQAPSFPTGVDGSSLQVTYGPAEAAVYGDLSQILSSVQGAGAGAGANQAALASSFLAVGISKAPVVSSTGVSVNELKQILLAQPGISSQLKGVIESLDSPTGNLPIPIPADMASARQVTVQGVSATAVGDNTGLGSAVIWIKGGIVYVVAGTISESDAVSVAQHLG